MRLNCQAAVSEMHNMHPDKCIDLDSHICHRIATAEKHCVIKKNKSPIAEIQKKLVK